MSITWRKTVARTLEEAEILIGRHRPFTLKGRKTLWALRGPAETFGYLPEEHREQAAQASYTVFSYETPIAWVVDGEAHVPDVGYSPTTGQHQYTAAGALGVDFRPGRNRTTVRIPPNATTEWGSRVRARSGGIDGVIPGQDASARWSAYEGTGDDAAHMGASSGRAWGRLGKKVYRHPAHP